MRRQSISLKQGSLAIKNRPLWAWLAVLGLAALCVWPARAEAPYSGYALKVRQTRFFGLPLTWVGETPPSEAESQALWEAMGGGQRKARPDVAASLVDFLKTHPQSAWRTSIEDQLGSYYRDAGYFSLALEHWEDGWNAAKGLAGENGRMEADKGLLNWLQLLASLGRTDTMKILLDETKDRDMPVNLREDYVRMEMAYRHMLRHPEDSYRCGTYALNAVGEALYGSNYYRQIVKLASPPTGFSMADLLKIAASNNLDLLAVSRPSGSDLVVPSVVHWKENHYAAIVEKNGDKFRVVDPTFRLSRWLSADAINHEASGQFLVPSHSKPDGWRDMTTEECNAIVGKGFPGQFDNSSGPPCTDSCCGPGSGGGGGGGGGGGVGGVGGVGGLAKVAGCSQCGAPAMTGGMPQWQVVEPNTANWIIDEPLAYQTATGGRMSFKVYCHEAPSGYNDFPLLWPTIPLCFEEGPWGASWVSCVFYGGGEALLYPAGGGQRTYTNVDGTAPEYYSNTRLLAVTNTVGTNSSRAFDLIYPSGAEDVYGFDGLAGSDALYLLSAQIDPQGRQTTYVYNTNTDMVQYVIDCDGLTNTFAYTTNSMDTATNLLVSITDPYQHSVAFSYDSGGNMTNIIDAQGFSNTFTYPSAGATVFPSSMTTPYGTTSFQYSYQGTQTTNLLNDYGYLYSIVTEPDGGQQMTMFVTGEDFPGVPEVYTDTGNVPTNRPVDNAGGSNTLDNPDWYNPTANDSMNWANSFYWNRQQFENLPSAFTNSGATNFGYWSFDILTTTDYANARLRHWNQDDIYSLGSSLSMERLPSPDGVTAGKMTWWDYPNKPAYNQQGSSAFPSLVIRVQPDGSDWYQLYQTDQWGHRTNVISTYSSNGVVLLRTNTYVYSTNSFDLLQIIGPDGVTEATYGYNTNHQVLFMTNAVGYVTSYTYNTNQQLTSVTEQTGLVTTYLYDGSNRLSMTYGSGGGVYFGTNSYTYTNDLVYTHTDSRGLTTTNSWDNLERLIGVAYPDGTSMSYVYSNLDLVEVVDRLGHTNSFAYDSIRRKISATDGNGHTTHYGYCDCGGLDYITNALGQMTQFVHDNQGNVVESLYPDGYDVFNTYNSIRQLVARTDGAGVSVTNWFNNQGGLIAVSNAAGQMLSRTYDIDDRVVNSVNQNGVATAMTYDSLGRTLSRSYPDGGTERFGYSAFGLMAYTNQLTNITHYGYDAARRKIAESNALSQVTQYGYSPAGDLVSLTDAKSDTTQWGYDAYGRVTNKVDATGASILQYRYDADNRLTNRWSLGKTNTGYAYDNVGNLTNVTYPVNHPLKFAYDNINELTSMSDGIGTTTFTYTTGGQLASESGPWASDKVTYTYNDRLRMGLDLQQPNGADWVQSYGFDLAARMTGVTSPAGTFAYTYNGGLGGTASASALIAKIALPGGAAITNAFDGNARMTATSLVNSGGSNLDLYSYTYNVGNQRTSVERSAENTAAYTYDAIGQVIADQATEVSGGAARLNEQLRYVFDATGNLNYRTNNALIGNFQVNSLNELTANTNGGTLTVMGTTTSPATTVAVNGTNAAHYNDATFAATNMPLTTTYTATATDSLGRSATNTVTVSIAPSTTFQYDGNGNLTNDGLRNFAYDDENQLIQVWVTNQYFSQFTYDGKMRRRIRQEYAWQGGAWVQTNEVYYVYDGNEVIQERDLNNLPVTTYTRGKDLSGSLEGAGGIGGLLSMTLNSALGTSSSNSMVYHADGNGNITMLINSSQSIVAKYLYDAFGNILSKSGLLADANLYRFSSKESHQNSGLVYYLYRYYDPNLQRWPNRDPLGEEGGLNLYDFVVNSPLNELDFLGLAPGSPIGGPWPMPWPNPKPHPQPKPPGNPGANPPAGVPINNDNCANNLGYSLASSNGGLVNMGTNNQTTYPITIAPFFYFPGPAPTNAPPFVGEQQPPVFSPRSP